MPETPDFDALTTRLTKALGFSGFGGPPDTIREALKDVWNARGAADIAEVELLDEAPASLTVSAIRSLDR